jgi:acyl transferase domain-containing protein
MSRQSNAEDVCIVSYGCVLPNAPDPEAFWHTIASNHCSITPLPESRWQKRLFYSSRRSDADFSYSYLGACISEALMEALRKRFSHVKRPSRLQLLALEATGQALASMHALPARTSLYMGCTSYEDMAGLLHFFRHANDTVRQCMSDEEFNRYSEYFDLEHQDDDYCRNVCINSSVVHALRREFGIHGFSALIDGACASSLVAVALAVFSLRAYETDCVIAGGVDANLAPESFVIFCRAGVMAETRSIPFSTVSEGFLQGEGSVVFVMKRLGDALAAGDTIHAMIRGAGISSNGRSSSLFQLSLPDLIQSYRRAYESSAVPPLDFIEAHATGTRQGDSAELHSIERFFPGQRIALSSVKAMIGHTKATAGAAGILKGILMMKHHSIPPFLLSDGSYIRASMPVYLPRKSLKLDAEGINGGVSAFGFGGINVHIYLSSFSGGALRSERASFADEERVESGSSSIVLSGRVTKEMDELDELEADFDMRIPLKSYPQIDPMQRMAVIAARAAFDTAGIDITLLDRDSIGVICGSTTGIVVARNLAYRLNYAQMNAPFKEEKFDRDLIAKLRSRYPSPTKDTGPGMLNNMVACRVAHYFDFHGITCAIDHDSASEGAAMAVARTILHDQGGLIVLIGTKDVFDEKLLYFEPRQVTVYLLTTHSYAQMHRLPIISLLKEVRFGER